MMQPKARAEDLVCQAGVAAGFMSIFPTSSGDRRIPVEKLSVSFSSREISLVMNMGSGKRTKIASVMRRREDPLEWAVRDLVRGLGEWFRRR